LVGNGSGALIEKTANEAANSLLSALPANWTEVPNDDTKLIRRDTSGTTAFGQVSFSTVLTYIKSKLGWEKLGGPHTHVYVNSSGNLAESVFSDEVNAVTSTAGAANFDKYKQDQVTYNAAFSISLSSMLVGVPYRIWGGYRGAIVKNDSGSPITVYCCGGTTFNVGAGVTFSTHNTSNRHFGPALITKLANNDVVYCPSY
jgi:hypothetical protein